MPKCLYLHSRCSGMHRRGLNGAPSATPQYTGWEDVFADIAPCLAACVLWRAVR